jgi:hypothetical protein
VKVKEATMRLYCEVIPRFAKRLDAIPEDELRNFRLIEELHREGINVRHLGMFSFQKLCY